MSKLTYIKKRILYANGLVDRKWYFKLQFTRIFSRKGKNKIRVGFGPIASGEDDLNVRKWRIDPIVNEINNTSAVYTAGIFFGPEDMRKFDVIIVVKNFSPKFFSAISELKAQGKKCIYDIVDNPACDEAYRFYYAEEADFLRSMDGCILSNPLQKRRIENYCGTHALIEHPVINTSFKQVYEGSNVIRVLVQGYCENLNFVPALLLVIQRVSEKTKKKIILTYHSNTPPKYIDEHMAYVRWTVKNCFSVMAQSDIAISIKDLHDDFQREKPATKVTAFMAAGLPVICTPTDADRLVMTDKETGYFVFSDLELEASLERMVTDEKLREKIGRAARMSVAEKYSVESITSKYLKFFDRVLDEAGGQYR